MPSKQRRKSKRDLKPLGKENIRSFLKAKDTNQPPTPVPGKKSHTEKRKPLSARNASNDTGKMPEATMGKVVDHSEEDRVKEFTFSFQRDSTEHVARGAPDENLLSALKSSEAFKEEEEKYKGKEFHVIGKREFTGAVNLGMPCKCLPRKAHFEVIFFRNNGELCYRNADSSDKQCVIFHVRSTGKSSGKLSTGARRIIKSESLRGDGCDLCIFSFKGETIREALCEDGRFLSEIYLNMWNLLKGQKSLQFTLTVNDLHNRRFEVELSSKKYQAGSKAGGADPSESQEERNVAGEGNELLRELKEEVDEYLGKERNSREYRKQWNVFKENFGKITSDAVTIRAHEMLVKLSESVGFVRWNNNGKQGTASCFLLSDHYILTCYHVVEMIVGDWVPEGEWGAIIQKSTEISFTYKDKDELPTSGWYKVHPWLEVYCQDLDYALLRLEVPDGQGPGLPPGVSPRATTPPLNGVLYIIGHPGGVPKSTDTCFVISLKQREVKVYNHPHFFQVGTKYTFREMQSSARITYNTCFFHGASGSPVFNFSGELVGMHAGGYPYDNGSRKNSVIEYGPTVEGIAAHMKKQHPGFDWSLLTGRNQAQGDQNMPSDDQEQVPMDTD